MAAGDPHAEALSAGARFAAVFDSISNVAIQGFTRDGSVRHWNPASQALCGYTEAEVFGHKIHDLLGFGPQEKRRFLSEVKRSWQTGEALPPAELAIRTKTGEVRWVYSTMLPVSEAGQVVEVFRMDMDITERRKAADALRESEERYRQITQNSPMGMHQYELHPDDRLVFLGANPAADRILGVDHAALMGKTIEDAFPVLIHTEIPDRYRAAARTGTPWGAEQIDYQDAQIRAVLDVWAFQTQSNHMVAMFADVTARKQTEKRLTDSEAKLRSIFRVAPTGIGVVRGRILVDVNARICEMTGYLREELIGQSARILYPTQEDFDFVGVEKYRQIRERNTGTVDTRWQRKDGTVIRVLLGSTPINPDDLEVGITFTALDITEREKIVEALGQSEEKFERAFRSSPVLMAITTVEEGRFLDVNECFLSTLGYRREEVVGRTSKELNMFVEPTARDGALAALAKKSLREYGDVLIRTKSGRIRHGVFSAETIDLRGQQYLLTVMNDTTERQELVAELIQKNRELEALIYAASHDLRSPLVNIQGFSRWLDEGYVEVKRVLTEARSIEEFRDKTVSVFEDRLPSSLAFIRAGVAKMDKLIDGLLQLSRVGRSALHLETLDMNRLLESVVDAGSYQIQQANAKVEQTTLPACRGDSGQINQVFSNLLDNALKYRDPTRPLRIRPTGKAAKDRVIYTVTDSGKGISRENLEKIWIVFWRLDTQTQSVGEGLGLPLTRRIVERHNGTIWVESTIGEGTRFFVDMPSGQAEADRLPPPTGEPKT